MVKFKESVAKVEAALTSTKKPTKKSKRDAEVDVDIQKNPKKQKKTKRDAGVDLGLENNPKKQKKEVVQAEKKAPPKKLETSSSSEKEVKDNNVEMADTEQKSNTKQPETPANETPTTQARGGLNKLFAGNLSSKIKKSDLERFFKDVGEIKDIKSARGYGYVEFASAEAVQKALKLNGKRLLGRNIKLEDFNTKPAPRSSNADGNFQRGEGSQVKTILVKKIGKFVCEQEMKTALRDHFSACGEITRIAIPCDQGTGATKGMAFLDLNEDGFNKALELNGSEVGGRSIVVTEAKLRGQNAKKKNRGKGAKKKKREENADGNSGSDRFSAGPGRGPGRGSDDRFTRGPGRGNGDSFKRGPERGNGDRRTPSKPSVLAPAQGQKIVFGD